MEFLKTYNSPFKRLKLKWYFGKVSKSVPYFLPRIWVKYTEEDILKAANESMNNERLAKKSFEEWKEHYKHYSKAVPKNFGFNFVDLGWKTKWTSTDFRFEHSPMWSFVFFGYQLHLTFVAPHIDHYWECFLFYTYCTDKTKSKDERIKQCIKEFPCVWRQYKDGEKEIINYYKLILKKKYLKWV